jgi:hypothetical protein
MVWFGQVSRKSKMNREERLRWHVDCRATSRSRVLPTQPGIRTCTSYPGRVSHRAFSSLMTIRTLWTG